MNLFVKTVINHYKQHPISKFVPKNNKIINIVKNKKIVFVIPINNVCYCLKS